jgi:UDP-N-acetyl-D-mannosaminuronate dehydrogenase
LPENKRGKRTVGVIGLGYVGLPIALIGKAKVILLGGGYQ